MRYVFSILACTSVLALSGGIALADNLVRSPLGSWKIQSIKSSKNFRSCELGNQYEGDFQLGFISEQSLIKNIVVSGSGAASSSVLSSASLRVTPGFSAPVDVQKIDENSITIDVSKLDGLFSALQSGYLLEIEWPNTDKHVFSLTGVKTYLRQLQSCSDVDWESKKKVVTFDSLEKNNKEVVKLSKQGATSQPVQINSTAGAFSRTNVQPEEKLMKSKDFASKSVHTPGVIIAPPSEDELIKPPEFDVDKMSQDERWNRLNVQDVEETYALARKNDFEQEIYWDEKSIKGQPKRVLSQSRAEAETIPVIIPAIEDNPKRIDLLNTDKEKTYISNQELERQVKMAQAIQKPVAISELQSISAEEARYIPQAVDVQSEMSAEPVAIVEKVSNDSAHENVVSGQWFAKAGESVRDVLVEWSLNENVELIWDSNSQFKVLKSFNANKSYEDAVASLLGQFMHQNVETRPVGQLYVDPNDGRKVLIIQTN